MRSTPAMAAKKISVGVVNHNGARYLERTLRGLGELGEMVDDILLVDNASTDDGVALVRSRFPRVRVIELPVNRGPGAARNAALREARHDRVLLIDNDARPEPGCVEPLFTALDDHPRSIMAIAAVFGEAAPDRVQHAGSEPHFLGSAVLLYAGATRATLPGGVRVVGSAVTCCVLADRSRFGDGAQPWFDESLFFYLEDHEFGLRAALQGYDLLVVPQARCRHDVGTIGVSIRETGRFTSTRVRHTIRNRWVVLLMLYQMRTLLRFAPALASFEAAQLLGAIGKGWLGHWTWAVVSTARLLPHVVHKRRALRRLRRRSDLEVLVGGPFPYNPAMHRGGLERAARLALDVITRLNWRLAGGRKFP